MSLLLSGIEAKLITSPKRSSTASSNSIPNSSSKWMNGASS